MKKIDLLVVNQGQSGARGFYTYTVEVESAQDLLEQSKEVARIYSFYYEYSFHRATVYINDPTKDWDYDTPLNSLFSSPEELFNVGGYLAIVDKVKEVQGVELMG
jgi:hypothetical protein